ncbi:hypothetical protein IPJ72_00875 [Candidatus Peregrinibacteria bacterium]|nr:MAG: hypothetical protein IPJ72_00875 [Candidatus Peregrinibacteria bacterium]
MKTLHLTIRTPDQEILDSKEVQEVSLQTEMGPLSIMAHHASLTGSILFSRLTVRTQEGEVEYLTRRGTLYVDNHKNQAVILVLSCEKTTSISYENIEEYLGYLESLLNSGEQLSEIKIKYLNQEKLAVEEQVKVMKSEK